MDSQRKKQWAAELLTSKSAELGRLPQKSDFDEITRTRIKAFLGPWPRALEQAGLKSASGAKAKSQKLKNKKER